MLAVVKTPLTSIRMKGRIPKRIINILSKEYGKDLNLTPDADDELVNVFDTEWYKKIKTTLTPGTYMKVFRQNKKMTQQQLGKVLGGIPKQHISNMEKGSRQISKKTAIKLAKIFNVSVEKFIG
jgi:DNA-binding XRE family transcriptional regulator